MSQEGRSDNRAQPGEAFGAYLVYERLGVGGMAEVYRAKKRGIEGFERQVALKRLLPALAADDEFVRSFVREARLASQLRHVNIAQTYDLGRIGGAYFIAMELVDGKDLRQILRHTAYATGPMPVPLILSVMVQLCEALDYAHTLRDESGQVLGIIHRDVSPSNVIVGRDGTAKLIDFGIARVSAGTMHTASGQIKGKFSYMAPEVLVGQLDARTDLWSLGVVAWELLTAQPLFTGGDDLAVLERVRSQEIVPPSAINRHCPRDLDHIVMTALARNPTQRWQTAAQLRGAIDALAHRPGMGASHQDLVRWIDWAFAQPAGSRRWDERAAGASVGMGAADEPSIVIEMGPPPAARPGAGSPMAAARTMLVDDAATTLPLPARPSSLLAAARTLFVDGTPQPEPLPIPASATATSPWIAPQLRAPARGTPTPFGSEPLAAPQTAAWTPRGYSQAASGPAQPPGAAQAAPRAAGYQGATLVPAQGAAPPGVHPSTRATQIAPPMAARPTVPASAMRPTVPAPPPGHRAPSPPPGHVAAGTRRPPTASPFESPEYRAAVAAFEARIAPAPPGVAPGYARIHERAASVPAPTAQTRHSGVFLVAFLCALAAAGGYFFVHWLTS
jgi:eukaryotic-like serine/threonine-protein kinase